MEKMMHKAAQYLATAAISLIEKIDDDSHTNLGWEDHSLVTHPFPNGDALALNYTDFSLNWIEEDGNRELFSLNHKTHKEVLQWLNKMTASQLKGYSYAYQLHYDLPYEAMTDRSRLEVEDLNTILPLMEQRDLAQQVLTNILQSNNFESDIRIWPHHFDTGAFVVINDKLSIGFGMAMPDSFIDDFYFYVSGYDGHTPIQLSLTDDAMKQHYYTGNYQGFALPVVGLDTVKATAFCQMAIDAYLNTDFHV